MRLSFRKIAFTILGVYFLITCYTGFLLFRRRLHAAYNTVKEKLILDKIQSLSEISDDAEWNPWGEEFENERDRLVHHEPPKIQWEMEHSLGRSPLDSKDNTTEEYIVEVWGKAAIGLYLWEHIFNSQLEQKLGGVWSFGVKKIHSIKFRFRTGPGVIPSKVPRDTENLVLVLNGRETSKIDFAKLWLDFLPTLPNLKNAAVIILGNEQCRNDWLKPYLRSKGGPVKLFFLTYDSPDIDNTDFYQWPVGVATYREFPKVDSAHLPLTTHRKYLSNFLGTIYKNSSREVLLKTLEASPHQKRCYIKPRMVWLPQESDETREDYLRALAQSDLTLNPVGINTECYRIYEAMSYGSVPVVEDIMTPGSCGPSSASEVAPLRLLKEFNAPIIFIKNWSQLHDILEKETRMTHEDKIKRRQKLIQWYENFKYLMRERLVRVLEERFFNIKR
ncbi:ribitol-5-phosphate xylosyltransferase 1-like [Gigantopelta aegis]|uniref:ribitol-5-phosphate xylosyltransferase 1-like n=1 Tax=Gigantopelta aegis TaxID=1735272 RepID=UPI001B88BAC7|nr:ribitol-5-phosphate xylosyltransferase 1-like [Gigantopelta aegis]